MSCPMCMQISEYTDIVYFRSSNRSWAYGGENVYAPSASKIRPQPRVRVMARVSTTKHQHKPNQQKITTQIKQPKIN